MKMTIKTRSVRIRHVFAGLLVAGLVGFAPVAIAGVCNDADDDGVCDWADNCTETPNPDQLNTNAGDNEVDANMDFFGNACDADIDNNGVVGWTDRRMLKNASFTRVGDPNYDPDCDFDGDGVIGLPDWNRFRAMNGREPGPAGE